MSRSRPPQAPPPIPAPDDGRRRFVLGTAAALALGSSLSACGGGGTGHAAEDRFGYGVASGDPLSDRVILWTRVNNVTGPVAVQWQVATDANFANVVQSGTTTTDANRDFTVKVDATGLQPGTVYHYRFQYAGEFSRGGITRTLPVGDVSQVKLAVFSCAAYPLGQFHVYANAAARGDIDVGVFLGDYIYETGLTDAEQTAAAALERKVDPQGALHTLPEYRQRYTRYHTDSDLRAVRAVMPIIAVWDDHEIANGAWHGGDEEETGDAFIARRNAAVQAFHEWMPTRVGSDPLQIYRSFDFGKLLSLHMLETRLIARDAPITRAQYLARAANDPNRQLLGPTQMAWLASRMQASTATWQVIGQQVLMAPMQIPLSVFDNFTQANILAYVQALDTPAANRTPQQQALVAQPKIGFELDNWDAFQAQREQVLSTAHALDKNLVVLSGDSHNAWASDLRDAAGDQVGVEFGTPSVTSFGLEHSHSDIPPAFLASAMVRMIPTLRYAETNDRGYIVLTLTPTGATAEFVFVSSVLQNSFSSNVANRLRVLPGAGNRALLQG